MNLKKITITLVLMLVVSFTLITSSAIAKNKMGLAHQALNELGIDKMEIVSVRMTSRGEFETTLYIVAKTPEGGLVSLKIYRDKTVLWGRHPWILLRADKIR